jgi:hypothetical protein
MKQNKPLLAQKIIYLCVEVVMTHKATFVKIEIAIKMNGVVVVS